jgi:hypothetical protein
MGRRGIGIGIGIGIGGRYGLVHLGRDKDQSHCNEPADCLKWWEFHEWLSTWWLLKIHGIGQSVSQSVSPTDRQYIIELLDYRIERMWEEAILL